MTKATWSQFKLQAVSDFWGNQTLNRELDLQSEVSIEFLAPLPTYLVLPGIMRATMEHLQISDPMFGKWDTNMKAMTI